MTAVSLTDSPRFAASARLLAEDPAGRGPANPERTDPQEAPPTHAVARPEPATEDVEHGYPL